MPRIPIQCTACGAELDENEYLVHMDTVHGGKSQVEAVKQKKLVEQNTPKIIPLDTEAPVPLEMQETLKEMEQQKVEPKKPIPVAPQPPTPPTEIKPLELKYQWTGNCLECNTPVRTIITKIDGRWFATAFCITHEDLEQMEVHPIEKEKKYIVVPQGTIVVQPKKEKKDAK